MRSPITAFMAHRKRRSRGQALVEFAIAVPVLLLILLIIIDAGRMFYGWVSLQNASRIAASYAADHADAWPGPSTEQTEYLAMVARDTQSLGCAPQPVPTPVFAGPPPPRSPGPGHEATVTLQCAFSPFAPLIDVVIGDPVMLTATTTYPIRSGILAGLPPTPTPTPSPTPTPTPTPTPSPTPTPTPDPLATPTPSPSPTPTPLIPPGQCQVPGLIGQTVDAAKAAWEAAGFNPNKLDVTVGDPNYIIGHEFVDGFPGTWDGTLQSCGSFRLTVAP